MVKNPGKKKSPAALEPWLEKQLGHPLEQRKPKSQKDTAREVIETGIRLPKAKISLIRFNKPATLEVIEYLDKEVRKDVHNNYVNHPGKNSPDKKFRPLSQNLSYKTYHKLRNREDNWGTIYRELAELKKNPNRANVEIGNRPVRVIGGAIKRYKNTYMKKKGSKAGISGQDLFKKREEIDYQDLIQEAWIKRRVGKKQNGEKKRWTKEGLYDIAKKHDPEKGALSNYARDQLKWKIHDICKDPSFEENEIKRYAHVQSFSERWDKSYGELAAKWGKEVLSDSFYEKLYREEARGNLEPKGNLEANLTEAASGGFEPGLDPFERDLDTIKNDFNPRFQVALETELTNRQKRIIDLLAEGYWVRSAKDSADIERILKWEPDFDGIGKRQIEREKSKIRETLRAKFPDEVIDNSNFNPENLDNWKIYSDKKKLKEHLEKVEKRQKEEKGDRIKAGFNFGRWPKRTANKSPLVYVNKKYAPNPDAIDYCGLKWDEIWYGVYTNVLKKHINFNLQGKLPGKKLGWICWLKDFIGKAGLAQ